MEKWGKVIEPVSYTGTCATEAMWDAGQGGEPEAICRYCEGSRRRDAPRSPRPTRVAARTVGCCVALLGHIDIWPSSGALHPVRPGHNASRAWLWNRFWVLNAMVQQMAPGENTQAGHPRRRAVGQRDRALSVHARALDSGPNQAAGTGGLVPARQDDRRSGATDGG